jgi:type III secretion system FlhB-like substrate exporter
MSTKKLSCATKSSLLAVSTSWLNQNIISRAEKTKVSMQEYSHLQQQQRLLLNHGESEF